MLVALVLVVSPLLCLAAVLCLPHRLTCPVWCASADLPLFRPDISPVGMDRASIMRCHRSLMLAIGRRCCCHPYCQPRVASAAHAVDVGEIRQLTLNLNLSDSCFVVCGGAPCPTIVQAELAQERCRSARSKEVSPIFVHGRVLTPSRWSP